MYNFNPKFVLIIFILVAIKKFKETEDDEMVRKNIQREVKMLRLLKHKNIVEMKEAFKRYIYISNNLKEKVEYI